MNINGIGFSVTLVAEGVSSQQIRACEYGGRAGRRAQDRLTHYRYAALVLIRWGRAGRRAQDRLTLDLLLRIAEATGGAQAGALKID